MHDRIRSIVRGQRGGAVRGVAGLLAAAAAAALVLALVVGGASAPSADARSRAGTCNPFGLEQAIQIYPIADGSYGFSVYGVAQKVTLSNVTNTSFDWSSTVGIDAVVVKSWFNGDVYTYDEAVEDTGLKTSKNRKAVFCLDTDPPPTATETPQPAGSPMLHVRKFNDLNANGQWDAGEPEIGVDQCIMESNIVDCGVGSGWPVSITEPTGVANGHFTPVWIISEPAGAWQVCEESLAGWNQTASIVDGQKNSVERCVTIQVSGDPGESHEVIFGNSEKVTPTPPEPTATAEPQKCTNRKGCVTPEITPEEEITKCTNRKGCPTPTQPPIE